MNKRIAVAGLMLSAMTLVGVATQEGYKEAAYIPVPGDVPTIGFGSTKGVHMGDKTTPVRSLIRLMDEVEGTYANGVKRCVTVPLHQYEFGAYVSLTYNIGVSAFCKSTIVKKLNSGDYAGACAGISDWNKAGGKVLKGLVNRRKAERDMCEGN